MSVERVSWWRSACRALEASGVKRGGVRLLALPWNREKRLRRALLHRRAVLDAKNAALDYLLQAQAPLAQFSLRGLDDVNTALHDSARRRVLLTFGINREMLAQELAQKYGTETGKALDQALLELAAEGAILRVPGQLAAASSDLYLAVCGHRRQHYDVSNLNHLLREGRDYRGELVARQRKATTTGEDRSYRL